MLYITKVITTRLRAIEPYERKKAKERQLIGKHSEDSSQGGNGDSREKVAGWFCRCKF